MRVLVNGVQAVPPTDIPGVGRTAEVDLPVGEAQSLNTGH